MTYFGEFGYLNSSCIKIKYYDDSSELHCASLLRTIFVSLARANERVHVQNVRNFPQARLESEIRARFFLNEHGDLYFLLHNNSAHVFLFNLKKF